MARLFIDSNAGLCPGVKKAIAAAIAYARGKETVFSYGELVHNPELVAKLREAGVIAIDSLKEAVPGCSLIIRAHGVPPTIETEIKALSHEYLDLTCARVKLVHNLITQSKKSGRQIIIVGHPAHPETRGHMGYAGEQGFVISDLEAAERFDLQSPCIILAQTTTSYTLFMNIVAILKNKDPHIKITNTICSFVVDRQEWIRQYAQQCDAAIIIGGKKSSNTARLFDIAAPHCAAFWVESQDDLDVSAVAGFKSIALTAGTSTPEETINKVIEKLYDKEVFPVFIG